MRAIVTWGTLLIAVTYGLARFGYGLFLPQFSNTFELSPTVAGVISAGSFLSYCLSALIASRVGGHPRRMIIAAGATATLGSVGVAASPDVVVLALSVLVAGAGAGLASPGLVALVQRNLLPSQEESAQSIVNSGTGVGILAAGLLVLVTSGHWRGAWLAIAVLALVATIATLRTDSSDAASPGLGAPARARIEDLRPLARPGVAAVLAGTCSAATWTFGPSIMTSAQSGDDTFATVAWMVLGAFGVLGAFAGKLVQTWSLEVAWRITCVAMACATVVLGLAPGSPVLAYAAVAVFGATYTALSGVLIIWAVRATAQHAAEGTVVLFVALAVGQALGSATFGLAQGLAPSAATFTLAGVVGLLAAAVGRRTPGLASKDARPRVRSFGSRGS